MSWKVSVFGLCNWSPRPPKLEGTRPTGPIWRLRPSSCGLTGSPSRSCTGKDTFKRRCAGPLSSVGTWWHLYQITVLLPTVLLVVDQVFLLHQYHKHFVLIFCLCAFSALTLLVGWQEGHPAWKNLVRCWRCYLSGARCRLAYCPADATATHCLLLQ